MSAFTTQLDDSVAVVTLDLPGETVNTLTAAVRLEFEALLIRLRDEADIKAVVLISGKPDSFIAGADIEEFTALTTQAEAERLSFEGQEMVSRIETLPKPVVAAIHGACLGGGLELALACHYRVASDHPKTQLGLPEVQLGVIPGAGGTQRLPRLVGKSRAKDLILTARQIDAAEAERIGLANRVVPAAELEAAARELAEGIAANGPVAVRAAKEAIDRGGELPLSEGLEVEARCYERTLPTEDRLEALAAFAEKRPPRYRGR